MIDTDIRVEARFFRRWMTVDQMKDILSELDDSDILSPNRVGNLNVIKDGGEQIGYIDFNEEDFKDYNIGEG